MYGIRAFLAFFVFFCGLGARAAAPQEVALASLDGTPLKAWLARPDEAAADARLPTVVALHGCGGLYASSAQRQGQLAARYRAAADRLTGQGYAVLFPDSFTPRGEASICATRNRARHITQTERRRDALAALQWVRAQPWADPQRVALLGWSHGASAVLSATDKGVAEVQAAVLPVVGVAFYPGCADAEKARYQPAAPLMLLLAADDDWTPPAPCLALAARWASGAPAVEATVFAGAVHGFDDAGSGPVRERADVPSRLHPGRGAMQGPNPPAREVAWRQVSERLRSAFGRP